MRNHAFLYLLRPNGEPGECEVLAESNSTWPVLWRILLAQADVTAGANAARVVPFQPLHNQHHVAADAALALQRFERVVRWLTRCPQIAALSDVVRYLLAAQRHLCDSIRAYALPQEPAPLFCVDLTAFAALTATQVLEMSTTWWHQFESIEYEAGADVAPLLLDGTRPTLRLDDWRSWADGFGLALFTHPYFANSFRKPSTTDYTAASVPSAPATEAEWPHRHGCAVVLRNERYGYIDAHGNALTPVHFDEADDFTAHGVARVCRHRLQGLVRTDGSFAVPLAYEQVEWHAELDGWLCRRAGACTLVHADGSEWISAAYDAIEVLVPHRLLRVRRGGSIGALHWSGAVALACEYTSLVAHAARDSIQLLAGKDDCMGVIDATGRTLVPFEFARIEALEAHAESDVAPPARYLRVVAQAPKSRPKVGVWDVDTARLLVPCEYDFVWIALLGEADRRGFIVAHKASYEGTPRTDRYRVGVLDAQGRVLVPAIHAWLAVKADLSKAGAFERVREGLFWAWSRGEAVEAALPDSVEQVWIAANGSRTGAPAQDVATLRAPDSHCASMSIAIAAAFYQFVELPDYRQLRAPLLARCESLQVKGTILLAAEGINGTIAGTVDNVRAVLSYLRSDPRLAHLAHKESPAGGTPFYRMKVRLKREIVTMGVPEVNAARMAGTYVTPEDWNALINDPDVVVIDARNEYEVALGTFTGAINPQTRSFRELPEWLRAQSLLKNKPKVAMFCTGGIRCEKSTAFLRSEGFENVYHLQGGILKYLETIPQERSLWEGECFVFDERVAIGHGLKPGVHELCRSCREPIGAADKASAFYVEGVSCPKCYHQRSEAKKRGLLERQRQVELAQRRNDAHIGVPQELKRQAKRQRRAS